MESQGLWARFLRLDFFTGFLPSFFRRSLKCYSWIDSSFLIREYFCKDFKNQRRAWFSWKYAVEGTVNSMEQRLEFFVKLMAKNSISREKLSDRLLLLIILHGNMMNLLNLWIARQRRNSSTFVFGTPQGRERKDRTLDMTTIQVV